MIEMVARSCYNKNVEGKTQGVFICQHTAVALRSARFFLRQENWQNVGNGFMFEGNMFTPENEMGVIANFCMTCEANGWRIGSIGTRYPDAVIVNANTGKTYRAEFEYMASNFIDHGHDPRNCDLIICWINDLPDSILPILSLQSWQSFRMREVSDMEKELMHLRLENERLKRNLKTANTRIANVENAQKEAANTKNKERKARCHRILDVGGMNISISEREDGSEGYIMFALANGRGTCFEVTKNDERKGAELVWQAIDKAKEIRDLFGKDCPNNSQGKELLDLLRKIIDLDGEGQLFLASLLPTNPLLQW